LKTSKHLFAAIAGLSIVGLLATSNVASAAAKAGGSCSTVGATESGLVCRKVGSKNRWVKATTAAATPTTVAATTPAPAPELAPATTIAQAIAAAFPTTGDAPGVTDSTVKIGIISVVNRGNSSAVSTSVGDETAQINAAVDYINDTGGIAGRKVIAVIKEMNVTGNTFVQAPAICAALVDDEKVFAVSLQGHTFLFERECYTKKKTLVVDASNVSFTDADYAKNSPYLFSTSVPSSNRWISVLLKEAKAAGALSTSSKIGVFALNTPDDKALVEGILGPELKKAGIDNMEVGYSGFDSPVTFFTDAGKAIARFQAKGVDTVILMGVQGLGVAFTLTAEQLKFAPRYLTHSNETPRYMSDIPRGPGLQPLQPGTLSGAFGIGWTPYQDTDDVGNSFPAAGAESTCIGAYRARGIAFGSRNLARYALGFCDGLAFLQAAGKPLKALNIQAIAKSAETLNSIALPGGYKSGFSAAHHDGGIGYRTFKWDETCGKMSDANGNPKAPPSGGCWRFTSPVKTL
jgi:ABC-type branched-subunit amino acid transport system substrate-binding protein